MDFMDLLSMFSLLLIVLAMPVASIGIIIFLLSFGQAPENKEKWKRIGGIALGIGIGMFVLGIIIGAIVGASTLIQEDAANLLR